MLDRAHRLRRRTEFAAAIRQGRRAGRATLVVHLHRAEETGLPRAGFIVPRAVGGAVVRNAVQRRLRHLVRERLAELPAGSMLVVRALPAAAGARSARLEGDLDAALRAAKRGGNGGPAAKRGGNGGPAAKRGGNGGAPAGERRRTPALARAADAGGGDRVPEPVA